MHYSVVDEQRCEVKCKYIVQEVNLHILRAEKAPSHANRACSFLHSGFILLSQPEGWFSDGLLSPQILLVTSLSGALWWKSVYLYINVTADLMRGRKIWKSKKKPQQQRFIICIAVGHSLWEYCKFTTEVQVRFITCSLSPSLLCWLPSSAVRFIVAKKHTSRILDNSPSVKEVEHSKKHERSTRRPQSEGEW